MKVSPLILGVKRKVADFSGLMEGKENVEIA